MSSSPSSSAENVAYCRGMRAERAASAAAAVIFGICGELDDASIGVSCNGGGYMLPESGKRCWQKRPKVVKMVLISAAVAGVCLISKAVHNYWAAM